VYEGVPSSSGHERECGSAVPNHTEEVYSLPREFVLMCVFMCVFMYVCVCVFLYVYSCVYSCMCIRVCIHV
jgi:hypothetical protein